MNVYETKTMAQRLDGNTYPGRGIVLGMTPDGKESVAAYFIMGRSVNSRNRVFVEEPDGIRTEAYDPSKMVDPGPDCHQRRPDRHHPGIPGEGSSHGTGSAYPEV